MLLLDFEDKGISDCRLSSHYIIITSSLKETFLALILPQYSRETNYYSGMNGLLALKERLGLSIGATWVLGETN